VVAFDADYYDGKTSRRHPVRAHAEDGNLRLAGPALSLAVPIAQVIADPPMAGTRRILRLPGGASLQTDDDMAVTSLWRGANPIQGWVHRLERRWMFAAAALVVVAVFSWWCVVFGLPLAAQSVAGFVPAALERKLGDQVMSTLDQSHCAASALSAGRQEELYKAFGVLTSASGHGGGYTYRLQLRACRAFGPNAFALPGGTIVLTDEMAKLAQNDAQIQAVLAHEIGHVHHRHGLRMALQAGGLAALFATLAGDAASITSLAVALPTALLQSSYSRDFEDEADAHAFEHLKAHGLSTKHFADIMARMEAFRSRETGSEKSSGKSATGLDRVLDYLSSHPATARRIERALANQ